MSEYTSALAEQWPCAFSTQSADLHVDFVIGSEALSYVEQAQELLDDDNPYSHEFVDAISSELTRVRGRVTALLESEDPWDIARLQFIQEHYREVTDPEKSLLAVETPLPDHLPLVKIKENVVGWMAEASSEDLLAFLDWNEQRLRPIQGRLVERTARMHPFLVRDIKERLIDTGLLPAHVLTTNMLESAMQATIVHVMDPFTETGAAGYFNMDATPTIGILDVCVDDGYLYQVLLHEYLHSLGLFVRTLRLIYGEGTATTVDNEALVEHLTIAAIYGDPMTMDPQLRGREGVYLGQRKLLAVRALASDLSVAELSAAYCELLDGDETPQLDLLHQRTAAASRRLFPELTQDLGKIIAHEYNTARSPDHREEIISHWTRTIIDRAGLVLVSDLTENEIPDSSIDVVFELEPFDLGELVGGENEKIFD